MAGDDGYICQPQCPCVLTRKRIVLTILAICCMALVTWTVVVTAKAPHPLGGYGANTTYVFIDDSKGLGDLNITMNSVLKMKKHKAALKKAIKKVKEKHSTAAPPVTKLRVLKKNGEDLCKCICSVDSTTADMMKALKGGEDLYEL